MSKIEVKVMNTNVKIGRIIIDGRIYNISMDQDPDDPDFWWTVDCKEIKGCVSEGETEWQAIANIVDAIRLCQDEPINSAKRVEGEKE